VGSSRGSERSSPSIPGWSYHNDYEEIDGRGIRAPASSQRRAIDRRVAGRSSERYDGVEKTAQFARIGDSVPSAHMSCLAMRRSLLLLVLDRLERVPIGVDFFLFFVGVAGEGAMVIDPAKLTQYRRHAANSSRALSFDPASYLELVAGSRTMAAETRGAVEALGGVSILPWLEAELAAHALYVATAAPRPQRRAVGDALLGVLRGPRSLAGVERPSQWLRSWLFLVSPHLAARLLRPRVRTDFVEAHGP